MISPILATIIILSVSVLLMVVIPMLDASKKFGKYISLRYTLVVVVLAMALGCVLDFSHLVESSRNIVLTGGLVLVGLFVVVRSLEKIKIGPRNLHMTAKKGDIEVSAAVEHDKGAAKLNKQDENSEA